MNIKNINAKKLSSIFLAGLLLGCNYGKNTEAEGKSYLKTNTKVNLRDESNTESEIIRTLNKGEILEVVSKLDNGWYQVIFGDSYAYIFGDYVDEFQINEESNNKIIIANEKVRIRQSDSLESEVLGGLNPGDSLDYVKTTNNGWYQVIYQGQEAYVKQEYATLSSDGIKHDTTYVVRAKTRVRVRSEANTDSYQLGLLDNGEKVKFIEIMPNGWYKVEYKNQIGYVSNEYSTLESTIEKTNKVMKLATVSNETKIYSDKDLTDFIGSMPEFELCQVYHSGEKSSLISSEYGDGYVKTNKLTTIGDTCVVVDVSSQLLTYYENCGPVLTGSIVTGTVYTPTEIGLYSIYAKKEDTYLTGEDYQVHVDYWMPFNGGQGLHDAPWRKRFGGNIYEKNGSHGCVNLEPNVARELYNKTKVGTKVLIKR